MIGIDEMQFTGLMFAMLNWLEISSNLDVVSLTSTVGYKIVIS